MMVWRQSAVQMCFGRQQGERGYKKFIGVILLLTEFDCAPYPPRDRKWIVSFRLVVTTLHYHQNLALAFIPKTVEIIF
ncbi:hypothetical protein S96127_3846 [Yersinia pestis]|nr:hypothetical protein EX92_20165 [Yersinia pestis subsp. pestis]QOW16148.1 hypothetical protein S96127_3846 [Yersinia pestis]